MKLVCLGDSLTYGYKTPRSETWPLLLGEKLNINVINKGIVGDTTSGMLSRFYYDVVQNQPSHVIVTGGVNDLIWEVPLSVIKANIATLVEHSYHHRIIPSIGIPIPIDVETAPLYWTFTDNFADVNSELVKLRDWILNFSTFFKCGVIDFYSAFYNSENGTIKKGYYFDGVHPTSQGNKLMAETVKL